MIYLIGTRHDLQYTGATGRGDPADVEKSRNKFKAYLHEKAAELGVVLIAEEMSQQVLTIKRAQSIAKTIADNLGIEHRLCDPDQNERRRMRISECGTEHLPPEEAERSNRNRENYWLERISDRLGLSILFVCGSSHVSKFRKLLEANGHETKVLHPDWAQEFGNPIKSD